MELHQQHPHQCLLPVRIELAKAQSLSPASGADALRGPCAAPISTFWWSCSPRCPTHSHCNSIVQVIGLLCLVLVIGLLRLVQPMQAPFVLDHVAHSMLGCAGASQMITMHGLLVLWQELMSQWQHFIFKL
jgi:hypothetical protein